MRLPTGLPLLVSTLVSLYAPLAAADPSSQTVPAASSEESVPAAEAQVTSLAVENRVTPGKVALNVAEGVGNFLLVQFTSTALHETVHWGVLEAYGVENEGINFIPFQQQVNVSEKTFASMSRQSIFMVAMAPQVWDPLTPSLPRWIHEPRDGTWWLRATSMYYLFNVMFQGGAVITMTWLEFAGGEEPQKDVGVAGTALSDSRGAQAAFYAGTTLLLGTNIALRWPHVTQAWKIVTHRSDTWDLPKSEMPAARLYFNASPDDVAVGLAGVF